jgi:hypothetical protein
MRSKGVLAIAAGVVVCLLGSISTSASATELCSTNTTPCSGTRYLAGTTVTTKLKAGTEMVFTNSLANITCKGSTVTGTTSTSGGEGSATFVSGVISGNTFSECSAGGISCTLSAVNLNYQFRWGSFLLPNPVTLGTILKGTGPGEPSVLVNCGSLIKGCQFSGQVAYGMVEGSPAVAVTSGNSRVTSGETCPGEVKWDAEYEVTAPNPLFLVNP